MKWDATWKSPQPLLEVQRPGPCLELDLGRDGGPELMPWGLTYIEGSLCTRLCSECCGCIISSNPDDITLWFLRHLCFTQGRTQQLPDLVKNQSLVRIAPDQEAENSYLGCDSADRLASKQNQYKLVLSHFSRNLTLCDPMDCSPSGSSVQGILHAKILEWVTMSFSGGSS